MRFGQIAVHIGQRARVFLTRQSDPQLVIGRQTVLIFYCVAAFGLITGLFEVTIRGIQKFGLHGYIHQSPDIIWMAPLADVLIFSFASFPLWLIARRWPRLVSVRLTVLVFSFLCFESLLLMPTWLDQMAATVLALGLAVQTARWMGAKPHVFYSFLQSAVGWVRVLNPFRRRLESRPTPGAMPTTPPVSRREFLVSTGATMVALAVGARGWVWLGEQRALAALPPLAADSPNVMLIVLDTVRAPSLSLYGYARATTPNLERLADRGVLFERAVATASWTLPSHGTLFTGRYPHELSAGWVTPLDGAYPTLAEVLSRHGYMTAGFVANTFYCSTESGLGRGFAHYEDFSANAEQIAISSRLGQIVTASPKLREGFGYYQVLGRKDAAGVTDDFLRWQSQQEGRPFFAFLNYWDAHSPYLPPPPFDSKFGPKSPRDIDLIDRNLKRNDIPEQVLLAEINAYDGAVAYLDSQLGFLLDELQKRGALENTLVVVLSDHGEEFGEHDIFRHGHSLYMPSLHVPLVISFSGRVPSGKRVSEPVSLRDLAATVLELTGLEEESRIPGSSWSPYWGGMASASGAAKLPLLAELGFLPSFPAWFANVRGDAKSVLKDRYHYIRDGDGREELYDWEIDPWELRDLATTESGRKEIESLRAALARILQPANADA
jgi:arylsulfatase A-like enzyme